MFDEFDLDSPPRPLVLLVDDERFVHELVAEALKDHCELMSTEDGAEAVMAIEARQPDLIIMDVEMPGISGLDLCAALRESSQTANTPIIFLSGHDEIADRVAGYSAGGDDYVVKPFSMRELSAKVTSLLASASLLKETRNNAEFATSTAMTVMSNMGEISTLLEALKSINSAKQFRNIAEATISALNDYALLGAVQIRTPAGHIAMNSKGDASPVEVAVIEQMLELDRIFQFGKRLLITYEHVSILISNLPIDDPDRIGRLRDHLAMLAEGAEMRVQAIISAEESKRRGETIGQTLMQITDALREIDLAQRNSRMATSLAVSAMSESIGNALLSVALTESQEDYLTSVIRAGVERILDTHSGEINLQDKLSTIIRDLKAACNDETETSRIPSLVWSELFSVGNEVIDEDHKTLIIRMNQLYDAMSEGGQESIQKALAAMDEHARQHFQREEMLMSKSFFPGQEAHREQHAALLRELKATANQLLAQKAGKPDEVFEHVKHWAIEHIVTFDRALAAHLAHRQAH